jgi:hypothetical protein
MNNEPTLEGIEDFDNNESSQKRSMVKKVVVALLIVGAFYTAAKIYFSNVSDAIDTKNVPAVYK